MENLNIFDLFGGDDFVSFDDSTKKAEEKKATKKAEAKKVKINLPVKFITFGYEPMDIDSIEGQTEVTLNDIISWLATRDVYQAKMSQASFKYDKDLKMLVLSTDAGASTDDNAEVLYPLTICFGRESEIIEEGEEGSTLGEVVKTFSERLPLDKKELSYHYDIETSIVSLIPNGKAITDADAEGELNLFNGSVIPATAGNIADIAKSIIGDMKGVTVNFLLKETILYPMIKIVGGSKGNNSSFVKNKGAKISTEKKYKLPFKVYLNNIHKEFQADAETFPNKEKVTAEEIDEVAHKLFTSLLGMKQKCAILEDGVLYMNHDIPGNRLG